MVWNGINIPGIDLNATSKRISQLLDESGLTDKELGEIMGLSVQSINKWRHGHNLPDIENLFFLSRILGVKVDDFLIPFVVRPQIDFDLISETERLSTTAITRFWTYFIKLKREYLNYQLSDNFA